MLVDPQGLWAQHAAVPLASNGGRAIEVCACVPGSPGYALLDHIGRVFELEGRHWTVRQFFLPVTRDRTVRSGVRALVADEFGYKGFVNQRDLEILLGLKRPGEWCYWLGAAYPEFSSGLFYGVCADPVDLLDELHHHESELRAAVGWGVLYGNVSYERNVHKERGIDFRQVWVLLWDADPETGMSPDPRFETVELRWRRVEEQRVSAPTWR